jgi:hypothetical protein
MHYMVPTTIVHLSPTLLPRLFSMWLAESQVNMTMDTRYRLSWHFLRQLG